MIGLRALGQRRKHPGIVRLGSFGSNARGDWGVGSDLDLVAILDRCHRPFAGRPLEWDTSTLPVPSEILVYTREEWDRLLAGGHRFAEAVAREAVWL